MLTPEQYALACKENQRQCPWCGGSRIMWNAAAPERIRAIASKGEAEWDLRCDSCDNRWAEQYVVYGFRIARPPIKD